MSSPAPAPSQAPAALLSYTCFPSSVPISQPGCSPVLVDLLIGMTNGGTDPVVVSAVGFAVPVGQLMGSLTNQPGTITPDVVNDRSWSISGDGAGNFTAKPSAPVTLQPQAGVKFRLRGVVVSPLPGLVVINVYEQSAPVGQAAAPRQGTADLVKESQGLAITSFSGAPVSVTAGQPCLLTWATTGADHCILSWDGQSVSNLAANGTYTVNPLLATTYTLTAVGGGGSTSVQLLIPVPVQIAFTAPPALIPIGGLSTLSWVVKGATSATLSPEAGDPSLVSAVGSRDVHPTATTTYSISASSPNGGSATATATVNVQPLPAINAFSASPADAVPPGGPVTLSWDTSNGDTVTITPGVGTVAAKGQVVVNPATATTYTLTCTNLNGPIKRDQAVAVDPLQVLSCVLAPSSDGSGGTSAYWTVWGAARFDMGIYMNYSITCQLKPEQQEVVEVRVPNLAYPYYGQFSDATGARTESDLAPYSMSKQPQPPVPAPDTPRITYFWTDPDPLMSRNVPTKTLRWTFVGATSGVINPGNHAVGPTGSLTVTVGPLTSYSLTVTAADGTQAVARLLLGSMHPQAQVLQPAAPPSLR